MTPPGTGNPEFTPTAAAMLAQQPDTRLAAMLAKLGYDPSRPGQVGRFLAQILQPMMEMQYRLGAFANGSNGENYDPMNFAGDISNQAASFLQKGANPFAAMRNLGNSVAQNPAFLQMVGAEPDEQNQYKMLQFLNSAQTSGLNPLIQSARGNELDRSLINYQMAGYNAANAGQPGPNNFLAWLQTQPADIQAMILGRR